MPFERYRELNSLSQSDLSLFLKSPLHFKLKDKIRDKKKSQAMDFGSLYHLAVLEPKKFVKSYALEPKFHPTGEPINKRKKDHREFLDAWKKDQGDKIFVDEDDVTKINEMANAILEHETASSLLKHGLPEHVSEFTIESDGLIANGKARADYIIEHETFGRTVIDVKTSRDASREGFEKSVINYNYDLQSFWYKEAFDADTFIFIVQATEYPYAIGVYNATDAVLSRGEDIARHALKKYFECSKTGVFHGYTNGIEPLSLPRWVNDVDNE